jgi:hypothetical protein
MLTREQNELVTRIGPGAPMGNLLRRYWIPALLAGELPENECPPVRVKLLSERLVAWRDTQGRYALTDESARIAAFRCGSAAMKKRPALPITAGNTTTRQCIDVPSEPQESGFCNKIKLKSHPLVESGGIFLGIHGPRSLSPAAGLRVTEPPRTGTSASVGKSTITAGDGRRHD